MPRTVYLQKTNRMDRVTRVLDRRTERLELVLISLLRRTPTFVSKGTEQPEAIPQEGEEDAMDEDEYKDGESPEEGLIV